MSNWLPLTLTVFLLTVADVPGVERLHPSPRPAEPFPPGEEISVLPNFASSPDGQDSQPAPASAPKRGTTLQDQSKLDLIRYVSGEFAKALKPLPAGKEGFLVYVGKPVAFDQLDRAVATHGAAVNTGDSVQITKLDFRAHTIAVDVNGGGKGKKNWRQHIQFGMGGVPTMSTQTTTEQEGAPPGIRPGMGSTIFLEFDKTVPDLAPEDLKQLLSPFLDFSKQRS